MSTSSPHGYLCLVLHSHLPFVRHPEHERFLEENWLFEAITESYIPLLVAFERLHQQGIHFRLTVSLSPTLLSMLADELLCQRYQAHLQRLIQLTEQEIRHTRNTPELNRLARLHRRWYKHTLVCFQDHYQGQLIPTFARLCHQGRLELITCAATHGFLPLLQQDPGSVSAQLRMASDWFQRVFGHSAPGIWLPECGYYPGLETLLAQNDFKYFFTETHALEYASDAPVYGHMAPIACTNGVAAFARDPESSRQVWCAETGYPADPAYREFHRDIGFERDLEYLTPYLPAAPDRSPTGIKYHAVGSRDCENKPLYQPRDACRTAQRHAQHFLACRQTQSRHYTTVMDRPALIVAPYDTELFGHWWFEGPFWLETLIRDVHQTHAGMELVTPSDYLQRHPILQTSTPAASSWGDQGYNRQWLNEKTDWVYPHLHTAAQTMRQLACKYQHEPADTLTTRALTQAGRSLLLAQASDWPFMLTSGTNTQYAARRIRDHLARFNYLTEALETDQLDTVKLQAIETLDCLFPNLDFRIFAS